ncbi:hypothetical protein BDY19DRAFT_247268 [Irpex rosettiformis]|uniref:Uncharacterized protein n=1 Tax=Irpex rosettiformis TaxID=378272 RepID=A0ACB8TZ53_9APHY|nr:hypothetical protein BDY19DRAFT_247268 [Irpex rosettiformis]
MLWAFRACASLSFSIPFAFNFGLRSAVPVTLPISAVVGLALPDFWPLLNTVVDGRNIIVTSGVRGLFSSMTYLLLRWQVCPTMSAVCASNSLGSTCLSSII